MRFEPGGPKDWSGTRKDQLKEPPDPEYRPARAISRLADPMLLRPSLEEELDRLPVTGDLVINVHELDVDGALAVAAVLRGSDRLQKSGDRSILVCEEASVRRLFERLGLDRRALIELSFDDALRDVLGRAWLGEGVWTSHPVAPDNDRRFR